VSVFANCGRAVAQPSLERRCQCGISQKDGFTCAFMDGAVIGTPRVGMKQARPIRPTHHARKEKKNGRRSNQRGERSPR
jgi:hypothetical protein